MTILTTPADAGGDALRHLWFDLSRSLSRWLMEPVTPPAPTRTGFAGGPDGGADLVGVVL